MKGADGYQIAKKFYDYDEKDNNGKKIDYTTYVFETQDGAYSDFGVRPYKVVNGQTIYGPWKFFPKTDQTMTKITAKMIHYKVPKGYQSIMLRSISMKN